MADQEATSAATVRWEVRLVVTDGGDDNFWRKAEGIEPDARLERYVRGIIEAAQSITKYGVESIEVSRAAAAITASREETTVDEITVEEAALVRKVLATTGYTAPMHERHEARRIVEKVLPPITPSRYPGFSDWPNE